MEDERIENKVKYVKVSLTVYVQVKHLGRFSVRNSASI